MKLVLAFVLLSIPALAQAAHSNALTWTWTQGSGDPATGFHVWKAATTPVPTTGTPYAVVTPSTTVTYTDTAVSAGQTNFYAVTAFNPGGESTSVQSGPCVTPFQAPAAPSSVSATAR
jgi:hypothetical protein